MHLGDGERKMLAGKCHRDRVARRGRSGQLGGNAAGFWVTYSDTIGPDSRVPFIPFWEERRQTEHAAQWSTTIPCFLYTLSKLYFLFWIQPVAAINEERLRRLKRDYARPEKVGGKVANYCQDSFNLHLDSAGTPQTQDAASMANSEVSKCR